jgi:hypothetical protein
MTRIRSLKDIIPSEFKINYNFQPELTPRLDAIDDDFTQDTLNEIVLWKVNRYALFNEKIIEKLNTISKKSIQLNKKETIELLELLLNTKGVKIAMASAILRFKNPYIYQIMDQKVYRIVY